MEFLTVVGGLFVAWKACAFCFSIFFELTNWVNAVNETMRIVGTDDETRSETINWRNNMVRSHCDLANEFEEFKNGGK